MKKSLVIIMAFLAFILFFAGCASTSDSGNSESQTVPQVNAASVPAPVSTVTPKQAKKKGIDALYDGVSEWPNNEMAISLPMQPAPDSALWEEFVALTRSGAPVEKLEAYLLDWYEDYGWTPDFYAACHNYFFSKASDLASSVASEDDVLVVYSYFDRLFEATMHGFLQCPDRLDLWCGYVHVANMLGCYDNAAEVCLGIMDRLAFNNNLWYWSCNEPFYHEEGEEVMAAEFVNIMHDYICEWLEQEEGLAYAIPVAEQLVAWFPENPVALNDLAISYLYNGNLEDARPVLERANALKPDDLIVLSNLAYTCEDLGDYDTALQYAEQLIMSGNPDYVSRGINLCAEINRLMYPDK